MLVHERPEHLGEPTADYAPYSPCAVDDLVSAWLNYWALGHVHVWKQIPGPPCDSPARLQARGTWPT